MRLRALSLSALSLAFALSACDGADSSVSSSDLAMAGAPVAPAVVVKGKVVGQDTTNSVDTSTTKDTVVTPAAKSIVGTWTGGQTGMTLTLVVKAGGTGTYSMVMDGMDPFEGTLTWTGNGPSYTVASTALSGTCKVTGSKLTYTDSEGVVWTLTKS